MPESILQRSFAGGELAPALTMRADLAKYTMGLRTCRNFLVRREGGVSNRPGTRFVAAAKDNDPGKLLMRYISSEPGQSVLIEAGTGYFRFYLNGAALSLSGPAAAYNGATAYVPGDLVSSGGVNYYCHTMTTGNAPPNESYWFALTGLLYELPTPYGGVTPMFKWSQSGNVITITERNQHPRELICYSLTRWVLHDITTLPQVSAPTSGFSGASGPVGTLTYHYVVTTIDEATNEESNPSTPIDVTFTDPPTEHEPIVLGWDAVTGAAEYNVYRDPTGNGIYGYVGSTTTNAFYDTLLVPDMMLTPPQAQTPFEDVNDYPDCSATHQQRRYFGNTDHQPDAVWGSRIGYPSNFSISTPLQDDDSVNFKVAGNNHHAVWFLLTLKAGLILMTTAGEWSVVGDNGGIIKPDAIQADQNTYVGSHPKVAPVIIGNSVIYPQLHGNVLREIRFDQQVEGLAGRDLTLFAAHLFEGHTIVDLDYQQTPDSIIWACRSDGVLLGLTYIPEADVWGWHRHDSAAAAHFEDVCVVPELGRDVPYFLVKRTIGGGTVRYIEALEDRTIFNWNQDVFFVDCGLSYHGAPVSSVSGLGHLNGQVVAVVGDGTVVYNGDPAGANAASFTVSGGSVSLGGSYSDVHVGLAIRFADLETLNLDVQGQAIRDKWKRLGSVSVIVDKSARSFQAGPDLAHLSSYLPAPYDPTSASVSDDLEFNITAVFTHHGRFVIRHSDPLPLTILGVIPNVELGG
ncbi:MAG TPA: hypothetical protein VKB41_05065 [Steroidobacteraceae bacterium]|nr:hypothetical protein [Steroidobacteraceae bacterium]